MALRYRCLILDHDDTAVDSSASIHHPAHIEAMRVLRPGEPVVDLQGWMLKNFDPGIMSYLSDELGLTPDEFQVEYRIWREFTTAGNPAFYPGFIEALREYKQKGGMVSVVSHSESDIILRHYQNGGDSVRPDLVFGWEAEEHKRKPNPWPVEKTLQELDLEPEQALIVDDLKPGVLMSRATEVPIAASGWAHRIPEIEQYMRASCLAFLETVDDFRNFILQVQSGGGE